MQKCGEKKMITKKKTWMMIMTGLHTHKKKLKPLKLNLKPVKINS